jgi:phosphatidylinositol-3-phosphatase
VRGSTGRLLIRSLLDIRLSRFSMGLLACLSALATVVIISGGQERTPAQIAALAALHERPVTVAQAVAPRAAVPATTPAAGGSDSASASNGSANSDSASAGSSDSSASSGSSDALAGSSDSSSAGTSSDASDSGSDTSTTSATTTSTEAAAGTLPKVGHVFEIALSTPSYAAAFAHGSAAPYLRSLTAKGTLLSGYESLGSSELADYLAMVSGQGPNSDTRAGCAKYTEFPQAVVAKANGLVPGKGCVYPETALTIGDQVSASGHVWKAYIADMGSETCSHPNSNAVDDLALTGTEPGYDTRHNPFIYFHSLLDLGDCASDDVDLSKLPSALAHKARAATLSYIAPGECDDATALSSTGAATDPTNTTSTSTTSTTSAAPTTGITSTSTTSTTSATSTGTTSTTPAAAGEAPATADPCASGQPVGIAAENAFLKQWVPRILASSAYKENGVLIITFAGAGVKRTASGVRTGALVLSRYARKGKTIATVYRPYSLLRSVEDMLGYTPLAHAKSAPSFAQTVLHKTM